MNSLKIGFKEYEIINIISEDKYILSNKDKKFLLRKFDKETDDGRHLRYCIKRISSDGIKAPKLIKISSRKGYILSEYIEGETALDFLSKQDFTDDLFNQLFLICHIAKSNKMTLNYAPENFVIKDGKLYYIYPYFTDYDPAEDLSNKYLKLYFNTKELAKHMEKNHVFYDKTRIKDEFTTNKEIVMMTVKYYR